MSLCRAALLASNLAIANGVQMAMRTDPNIPDNAMDTTDYVDWLLCDKVGDGYVDRAPTANNLGGEGPTETDPEEMRLPRIKTVKINGKDLDLDLVVTINEDGQAEPYEANNVGNNKVQDCFGITNVKSGGAAHLNFRFTKVGEDATWYPPEHHKLQFKFTIFDVDESPSVKEMVIFDTPVDHLYLADGHEFHPKGNNTPEAKLYFESSSHGNGKDNPRLGPNNLNSEQQSRAITVAYQDKSEWNITFKAVMRDGKKRAKGGRNFMWAGGSDVPDAEACTEWQEPTFAWAICDDSVSNTVNNIMNNNLGGLGPNTDQPEEIRYGGVATLHGTSLDLVVKAEEGYNAWNISRNTVINANSDVGIHGCFGAINVAHDSEAILTFTFVNQGTNDPATIGDEDGFGFTVYDIDQNGNDNGNEERVRFHTKPHSWIYPGHEVEKIPGDDYYFKSVEAGTGSDNVFGEDDARDWDQIRRSVRVMYQGTASWKVSLEVKGGSMGRNFLFGGCLHLPDDVELADHAYKHVNVYHPDR